MSRKQFVGYLVAATFVATPALAQTGAAPAGNPPAGAAATATPASNVSTADFVKQAANSNMFEIQSSELALDKTQDSRVRDFAQRMVQDHTQAGDKMKAAAQGQAIPTSLDQEHAQMLQQLQQASGNDFNRSYVQMQFDGHQKAVALFDGYAQSGDNPQLKQFAQQTVPTLREHLQMITRIRSEVIGAGRTAQAEPGRTAQQTGQQFMTQEQPGVWRASKLKGMNVYNANNEKIGDINEVLIDREGKVEGVVIGVGGFLGMGERDVAVPFNALQWSMSDSDDRARTNRTGAAGDTTASTAQTRSAGSNDQNRTAPDHAILANATKDQLKNAPEFRYSNSR
jgi:putative membrane protein